MHFCVEENILSNKMTIAAPNLLGMCSARWVAWDILWR